MVRVITQETFDEVVKENVELFSMSPEEAIEDAIKQFHAQDVNLSNIITDLSLSDLMNGEEHGLVQALNHLSSLISNNSNDEEQICKDLNIIQVECNKDLAHKVLAGKNGAYNILIDTLRKFESNKTITLDTLTTVTSLMTGHPDLLDDDGISIMVRYLNHQTDLDILQQTLKWIRQCCNKHEMNRQKIFKCNVVSNLKALLEQEGIPTSLIQALCKVVRGFVLDDDIRHAYGNSHEHARELAIQILITITDLLKKLRDDLDATSELMLTLSTLLVRNEFCQTVQDAGGVICVMDVMVNFPDDEKLNIQSLKLLKALAGNDDVKAHIITVGVASLIVMAMNRHQSSAKLTANGNACLAVLSLRSPTNSKVLCDAGARESVIEGMKSHMHDADVQKQGCWAIRNLVVWERSLVAGFLELGAEDLLHQVLKTHPDKFDFDIKSALRDLGCNVKLTEQWTGKGKSLD